jgi:hypothetical protein
LITKRASDGAVQVTTSDNTCTVPVYPAGGLSAGVVADEGYVEVIAMGETHTEDEPVAVYALHDENGEPANCNFVQDNFVRNRGTATEANDGSVKGVWSNNTTFGRDDNDLNDSAGLYVASDWDDSNNPLAVSWFIREPDSGWEIGARATHVEDFLIDASITNQSSPLPDRLHQQDTIGYDYPDLNGHGDNDGGAWDPTRRGNYVDLHNMFAANSVSNDWVYRVGDGTEITADWVVTFPGQYALCDDARDLGSVTVADTAPGMSTMFDREEQTYAAAEVPAPEDDIVVSPGDLSETPPGTPPAYWGEEVNLFRFSNAGSDAVGAFGHSSAITWTVPAGAESGWAKLGLVGESGKVVCDWDPDMDTSTLGTGGELVRLYSGTPADNDEDASANIDDTSLAGNSDIFAIGYAAWKKVRADEPAANYGRAVDHTWTSTAP